MISQADLERVSTLHRESQGVWRVGASPLTIVRHGAKDWGVYCDALEGRLRVPGAWSFRTLGAARARAFAVARERGWA